MLLKTRDQIRAARDRLPSGTIAGAADIITNVVASDPNRAPQDQDEAISLVVQAVLVAKMQRLGRELTEVEAERVLEDARPYAEQILIVGLSGAQWQLETADKIKKGAKWAGKAALIGVGAALGIGLS